MSDLRDVLTVSLKLVNDHLNSKRFAQAMGCLVDISKDYHSNELYLLSMRNVLYALNDQEALIKTLQALVRSTKDLNYSIELMCLLYQNSKCNEALDVALSIQDQPLSDTQLKKLVNILSKIYIEFSDFEGIADLAKQYTHLIETEDDLLLALGCVAMEAQDKNEAINYFRKAAQINSSNDQAWISLAVLHHEMGDMELAWANLERALDANPENATGLKLMNQWQTAEHLQEGVVAEKVKFFLSKQEFHEEISLCYMQILQKQERWQLAQFEIDKLILNNPKKAELYQIKKNLEELLNL